MTKSEWQMMLDDCWYGVSITPTNSPDWQDLLPIENWAPSDGLGGMFDMFDKIAQKTTPSRLWNGAHGFRFTIFCWKSQLLGDRVSHVWDSRIFSGFLYPSRRESDLSLHSFDNNRDIAMLEQYSSFAVLVSTSLHNKSYNIVLIQELPKFEKVWSCEFAWPSRWGVRVQLLTSRAKTSEELPWVVILPYWPYA